MGRARNGAEQRRAQLRPWPSGRRNLPSPGTAGESGDTPTQRECVCRAPFWGQATAGQAARMVGAGWQQGDKRVSGLRTLPARLSRGERETSARWGGWSWCCYRDTCQLSLSWVLAPRDPKLPHFAPAGCSTLMLPGCWDGAEPGREGTGWCLCSCWRVWESEPWGQIWAPSRASDFGRSEIAHPLNTGGSHLPSSFQSL